MNVLTRCALLVPIMVINLWLPMASQAAGEAPGTLGIAFRQIFSERVANHRGALAVMHVDEDSPAAKAGIHCSDFVIETNGVAVQGREFSDIMDRDISGPIGGTVHLSVVRYDGSQSDVVLVRAPFPPHLNPPTDPFAYSVPGTWSLDPRYAFPLPWSPSLAYHGAEDLFYAPNFDKTDSPEYHSYLYFMWLDGAPPMTASQLQSDMLVYFRGLAQERGKNYGFVPDLARVSARYRDDRAGSKTLGGAAARAFSGTVSIWDTHGKVITLNSEVVTAVCPMTNHRALFFGMSMQPRGADIWKQLDAIRDTFQCKG